MPPHVPCRRFKGVISDTGLAHAQVILGHFFHMVRRVADQGCRLNLSDLAPGGVGACAMDRRVFSRFRNGSWRWRGAGDRVPGRGEDPNPGGLTGWPGTRAGPNEDGPGGNSGLGTFGDGPGPQALREISRATPSSGRAGHGRHRRPAGGAQQELSANGQTGGATGGFAAPGLWPCAGPSYLGPTQPQDKWAGDKAARQRKGELSGAQDIGERSSRVCRALLERRAPVPRTRPQGDLVKSKRAFAAGGLRIESRP